MASYYPRLRPLPQMQSAPYHAHRNGNNFMFYMGKGRDQANFKSKRSNVFGRTSEGLVFNLEDYVKMPDNIEDDSDEEFGGKEAERGYMKLFKKNKNTSRPNQLLVCTTCGNSFTKLCNVLEHIHMHRGQRPFMCKYCNKRFA